MTIVYSAAEYAAQHGAGAHTLKKWMLGACPTIRIRTRSMPNSQNFNFLAVLDHSALAHNY